MTAARQEAEWGRTSSLMALLANCHCGSKGRWAKPADFDPTVEKRGAAPVEKVSVKELKGRFLAAPKT